MELTPTIALVPTATTSIRHSPTPHQINTKPHADGLLFQFLFHKTSCLLFSQKLQVMLKEEKKHSLRRQVMHNQNQIWTGF